MRANAIARASFSHPSILTSLFNLLVRQPFHCTRAMTTEGSVDASEVRWLNSSGVELIRELLNDRRPEVPDNDQNARRHSGSIANNLVSAVYSGPTIRDIESALSVTSQGSESSDGGSDTWRPIAHLPEKGPMWKIENKYTLKIKACGRGLPDDGYKWRKYGQKSIKNSPNPRSYYRCTNPRCNAKKQVEKSKEDPDAIIVTYEGLHLHCTYSQFLTSHPQDFPTAVIHAAKKPKNYATSQQDEIPNNILLEAPTTSPSRMMSHQRYSCHETASPQNRYVPRDQSHVAVEEGSQGPSYNSAALQSSQGLLEDVVPPLVRKPCNSMIFLHDHYPASQATSSSYSTFSWTPSSSEILSRIT